jgi:hypothetical protein
MRITLQAEGGFAAIPGLDRAVSLDDASLSPEDARRLEDLVRAAGEAAQSIGGGGAASEARDARTYTITIHGASDGGAKTIQFSDPVSNDALRALRDFVQEHGAR